MGGRVGMGAGLSRERVNSERTRENSRRDMKKKRGANDRALKTCGKDRFKERWEDVY